MGHDQEGYPLLEESADLRQLSLDLLNFIREEKREAIRIKREKEKKQREKEAIEGSHFRDEASTSIL